MVKKKDSKSPGEFDLDLIRIPKTFNQGGKPKQFVLYEASGDAATKYRNAMVSGMTLGPDGKLQKLGKVGDLEPLLISLCLFEVEADGKEKPLHESVIRKFPARVQKALYEEIRTISDLDEHSPERETLEEALNHSSAPISFQAFSDWVLNTLPDEDEKYDYRPLKKWMKPTTEEAAKNEQDDTTVGSR